MFTHDNNQIKAIIVNQDCNCQKNIFEAIKEFLGNHSENYYGEGICVSICKKCFEDEGENFILRPEISLSQSSEDIAFCITNDGVKKIGKYQYEIKMSFHNNEQE